ncbi:MAG: hypothetical protein IKQ61_09735 [Spirochaetales bacterium]|nr:hypothetical protein [Spirochaetales bacterium]
MKKNFLGALFLSAIMILAGCNNSVTTADETGANVIAKTTTDVNYNLCKMTAETQIMRTAQYDEKWAGAEITDHYYWYNPMIEDAPAYIEFKVTKDGEDAGYVMVSTTEQDFEVPEYSTEGKTMYECLQAQSGTQDITATRFNSFDYMAEVAAGRGESKRVFFGDIAYMNNSEGGRGGSEYDEYIAQYKAFREKIGGIGGSKVELSKHYEMKKEEQDAIGRGDPITYDDMYTYVDRSDWLPTYDQFDYKGGKSGCSPTSAAIILAYWHRFHGKTNFFYKTPSLTNAGMTDNEKDVIKEIGGSAYMKTRYHDGTAGTTDRYNRWDGMYRYILDHGYNHWCIRYYWVDHNSDEVTTGYWNTFPDWNTIFTEIRENRPAFLSYDDPSGHSAVIYDVLIHRDNIGQLGDVHVSIVTGWGDGKNGIPARKTVNAGSYVFYEVLTVKMW